MLDAQTKFQHEDNELYASNFKMAHTNAIKISIWLLLASYRFNVLPGGAGGF